MIERISNNQLYQLILANIRELIREPGVLFWGIVFPILMSIGLGVAFTRKSNVVVTIGVIGEQHVYHNTAGSESVIFAFLQNNKATLSRDPSGSWCRTLMIADDKLGKTNFIFLSLEMKQAMALLKRGKLNMIIDEKDGRLRYHFDPANPDAQLNYLKVSRMFNMAGNAVPASSPEIEPLIIQGTRYIDFLIPGLIAMGVMMSCMWGVSYAIIERRSKKLLRRMVATPMKRSNFLIALITVRILMNFVEAALLLLVAWLVFHVTIQGSMPALLVLFIAGNVAFAGIAVLLASHTAKTEIGNGLINAISMPMMVLSGIFFSYHNFPEWSIPFIRQFPLTMMADGIRSIMTEGAGLAETALPVAVLTSTGVVFFVAGMRFFRWH
jgi:ABC-2 type transport system permease protein